VEQVEDRVRIGIVGDGMDWALIGGCLAIGTLVGWLIGIIGGHGETQRKLEAHERKTHALLAHIHRMGALREPEKTEWFWSAWLRLRERELAERTDDQSGFFAEMHRP
jgi:hypothetical protein